MMEYPTLRAAVLRGLVALKEALVADDTILDHEDCPYDQEVKGVLRDLLAVKVVERIVTKDVGGGGGSGAGRGRVKSRGVSDAAVDQVMVKVEDVMRQLEELKRDAVDADVDVRMQLIKAQTALLEKHINMFERVMNVKRASTFEAVVIGVLDDLVDEDARDQFLKRIEPFVGGGE